MAWNKTLPADSSKLRLSAAIIRSNWDAIETGGVPYDYLQLSKQVINPTRADATGWLYTKDPGSGYSELYYEDDRNPAEVIRLTNDGGIGAPGQTMYADAITFDNGVSYTDATHQILGWLRVASNGAVTATSGDMTCARISTGNYTVTFVTPATSFYTTALTLQNSGNTRSGSVLNTTNNSFTVNIYSNSSGSNNDEAFHITVFGGR